MSDNTVVLAIFQNEMSAEAAATQLKQSGAVQQAHAAATQT